MEFVGSIIRERYAFLGESEQEADSLGECGPQCVVEVHDPQSVVVLCDSAP